MMSLDLNLLNVLLIVIIIYLVYPLIFPAQSAINHSDPDSYNYYPSNHPQVLLWRRYTPSELSIYDGTNPKGEGKILLAIRKGSEGERTVFDVTAGKSFYGPDGPYGNFAGRDASRGMAKQSFDEGEFWRITDRCYIMSSRVKPPLFLRHSSNLPFAPLIPLQPFVPF